MIKQCLLVILICCSICVMSQEKSGYIINNDGDTTRGYFKYQAGYKTPVSFSFYNQNKQAVRADLGSCSEVVIDDTDRFIRAVVTQDMRPVSFSKIVTANENEYNTDTVFLRVLVESGKTNLYALVNFKAHYFIKQNQDDQFTELTYKVILNPDNSYSTLNQFRNQLMVLADDNDEKLRRRIAAARYSEKELIAIVEKLNNDTEVVRYHGSSKTLSARYFVGIGAGTATLKHGGLHDLNFESSFLPFGTVGLDLHNSRFFKRLNLRAELSLSKTTYEGTRDFESGFPPVSNKDLYKLTQTNVSPSLSALYNVVHAPNLQIFIGIGAAYNFSLYKDNTFSTLTMGGERITYTEYVMLNKGWFNIHARTGIRYKRFELSANGQYAGLISKNYQFNTSGLTGQLRYFIN